MKLDIQDIISAVGGKCIQEGLIKQPIEVITTDSRSQVTNGLFIPLKGDRFDGHEFIKSVYEKGVIATLTMEDKVIDPRLWTIKVEDTRQALLDLGHYYRNQFTVPVVGITGSVGKTSTKEMVAAVLSGKWHVHKTDGNFNNEIGLPLTLFKMDASHEAAVIEMGMNHFGEIHRLSLAAAPEVAVITNVGTSHIENLGSREGILKAKLEILDGLMPGGLLVLNGDNDLLSTVGELPFNKVTYGLNTSNDYYAEAIANEGEYTTAIVTTPQYKCNIRIKALGEHMVYNTLAAIAVAQYLGLSKAEIQKGLESYAPAKMRMHLETYDNQITVIDDTYNASPDSMEAALKVLKDYDTKGRKIAVLGDMFEMGEFAPELHKKVGAFAAEIGIDRVYAVGTLAEYIFKGAKEQEGTPTFYYPTKEAFIEVMQRELQAEDTVLFKASRGMHFEEMLEAVRKVK